MSTDRAEVTGIIRIRENEDLRSFRRRKLAELIRRNYPLPRINGIPRRDTKIHKSPLAIKVENLYARVKERANSIRDSDNEKERESARELRALQSKIEEVRKIKEAREREIERSSNEMWILEQNVQMLRDQVDECIRAYDFFCARSPLKETAGTFLD